MKDKLQQLLDEYQQNYKKFNYGLYVDLDKTEDAIKIGLVGSFYLDQAYTSEKRQAIGQALALYDKHWGHKLKYGLWDGDSNNLFSYQDFSLAKKIALINESTIDTLYFYLSDKSNLNFVPQYMFKVFLQSEQHETSSNTVSYVQIYLPIYELENFGIDNIVEFIQQICQILQPLHGFFGLGIEQNYKYYDYHQLKCALARKYLGLDISNYESDKHLKEGFKSINWLTCLSEKLITDKLGSLAELEQFNHDEAIVFYPYMGGIVVRAGEVPEFGDIDHNPYPEHYVNVNALLKPARATEIAPFGFSSVDGKVYLNNQTSQEWQCRFDNVVATDAVTMKQKNSDNTHRNESGYINTKIKRSSS